MAKGARRFCCGCGKKIPQVTDCLYYFKYIDEYVCTYCSIVYPRLIEILMDENDNKRNEEEKTMDYNKKKDTSIDVMRYVTREEVVTVNNLHNLEGGDKIKVMINGEVYEAKVARRPPIDYFGEAELAIAVSIDKPLSKTWKDLGYDCFEDMIDDIAKRHGSLGHKEERIIKPIDPSNYIKIHDAAHEGKKYVYAESFGKSIIRVINDDGSSTIYDADGIQVYLEEEDD